MINRPAGWLLHKALFPGFSRVSIFQEAVTIWVLSTRFGDVRNGTVLAESPFKMDKTDSQPFSPVEDLMSIVPKAWAFASNPSMLCRIYSADHAVLLSWVPPTGGIHCLVSDCLSHTPPTSSHHITSAWLKSIGELFQAPISFPTNSSLPSSLVAVLQMNTLALMPSFTNFSGDGTHWNPWGINKVSHFPHWGSWYNSHLFGVTIWQSHCQVDYSQESAVIRGHAEGFGCLKVGCWQRV